MLRVAACHAAPVWLAARATAKKAVTLLHEASKNKAHVVVFPETFISAFPVWSAVRPPTENHDLFKQMVEASVYADGEEIKAIRETAAELGIIVSMGFSEKARHSTATLYNSNVIVGQRGDILVHHRKLMPTFFEKLTWAPGDGHGLRVAETPLVKIGGLICGENTNPLARYSLMAQGEQLHISTWPAIWPTRDLSTHHGSGLGSEQDTQSNPRAAKSYDNVAANRTRAAAHCFEAKCFGVLCSGYLDEAAISSISAGASNELAVRATIERAQRGASMFLDPTGGPLPSFTVGQDNIKQETSLLQDEEGILYADMNIEDCMEGKQYHDVVGGYQRLDVFNLKVNRHRKVPATFIDSRATEADRGGDLHELD